MRPISTHAFRRKLCPDSVSVILRNEGCRAGADEAELFWLVTELERSGVDSRVCLVHEVLLRR